MVYIELIELYIHLIRCLVDTRGYVTSWEQKVKFRASSTKTTNNRKSESVMVTPKKCKFLQLCEHQLSVKVTPTWCTFTPQ